MQNAVFRYAKDKAGNPTHFLTLTMDPNCPEIKQLLKRHPEHANVHEAHFLIQEYFYHKYRVFERWVLLRDRGGILPANTPKTLRWETNHSFWYHIHMLLTVRDSVFLNPSVFTTKPYCTSPQYPMPQYKIDRLEHVCSSLCERTNEVTGAKYCKNHYPEKEHHHGIDCKSGSKCTQVERDHDDGYISARHPRIYYMFDGVMNIRPIPHNDLQATVGYVHKHIGYMGKGDDTEVDIADFAHGEASFTCKACHAPFNNNAHIHYATCPNNSIYACQFCNTTVKSRSEFFKHLYNCPKAKAMPERWQHQISVTKQKSVFRPITKMDWDILQYPYWETDTRGKIKNVSEAPPWNAGRVLKRGVTLEQYRAAANKKDVTYKTRFEKYLCRPESIGTHELWPLSYHEFWTWYTCTCDKYKRRAKQKTIRTYDPKYIREPLDYIWWKVLEHPSTKWKDGDEIPTKDTIMAYALANNIISDSSEAELALLRRNSIFNKKI